MDGARCRIGVDAGSDGGRCQRQLSPEQETEDSDLEKPTAERHFRKTKGGIMNTEKTVEGLNHHNWECNVIFSNVLLNL